MKWVEFLSQAAQSDSITLVGPLHNRPHVAEQMTIYIDGGVRFRSASAFPAISVGDGDSAPTALDEVLPKEKSYSDLAFVLRSLPQSITRVDMHGFLGGRRDHELANYGEVQHFLGERAHFTRVAMWGKACEEVIAFCKGRIMLNHNGVFSVFVLETTSVKISGACKYPLNREPALALLSSHGLSNEGSGPVEIEAGRPVFVFLN
jgi:thiamine pyrophosphokinase